MKVTKTEVNAKSRTLKATWTAETMQDLKTNYNADVEAELSKLLAEEIRREQLKEMCERLSWTKIIVKDFNKISNDWCKKYIKQKYQNLGNEWYFENERDAHYFMLKWVTV